MPDNGIALERREAPGPTLLGPRARKRQPLVTGDLPWRAPNPGFGFGNRRRSAGGAWRSIASFERDGKKGSGPARAPKTKARDREVMGEDKKSWAKTRREECNRRDVSRSPHRASSPRRVFSAE